MASRSANFFQEFFRTEAAGGALLVVCACAALVVANSAWADAYHRLLATTMAIAGGGHSLSLTVHQWINDGLMAVFFLLVGLEIKREALTGELASRAGQRSPIAAIGAWCPGRSTCDQRRRRKSRAGRRWPPTSPSLGVWHWSPQPTGSGSSWRRWPCDDLGRGDWLLHRGSVTRSKWQPSCSLIG